MKATDNNGNLRRMQHCYIRIGDVKTIYMNNLPEISDGKSASYTEENAMGRSNPIKVFSQGGTRKIGWKFTLFNYTVSDQEEAINILRTLESCVYPKADPSNILPYIPPRVCSIFCGRLLADTELSVILTDYSVDFPTDSAWAEYYDALDNTTYVPTKFTISLNFEVVYDSRFLPGADRIIQLGV